MRIDPLIDFVGIWYYQNIDSRRDYSLFVMWMDSLKKGFSVDNFGGARILDLKIKNEENEIEFTKKYYKKSSVVGMSGIIQYNGKRKNKCYVGEWEGKQQKGKFILTNYVKGFEETELADVLLKCETKIFTDNILKMRKEFPFLPLNEIDF